MVGDRALNWLINSVLVLVAVAAALPLLLVLSASLTPYEEVIRQGGYSLLPNKVTFEAYSYLLTQSAVPRALGVTVFITVVGTAVNLLLTTLIAYPLSRRDLPGRTLLLLIVVIPMLFNSGIIPLYLIVQGLGLVNTVWAMILPNAISGFNVLVMTSFFRSLPEELVDAARIDGASEMRILWSIIVPLSAPVMLTVGLFYAVGHWNEFLQAILFVRDPDLYPLQVVVRNLLLQSQNTLNNVDVVLPTVTLKMAAVFVASLPILLVYPFIQRHFSKGVLLGSIKG
jgi:putative aldouronate transport system permease protein